MTVESGVVGAIDHGLLVYLGAARGDEEKDVRYVADKVAGLRIFPTEEGRMSRSVADVGGSVRVVSQFTLFGDVRRGRRPSFDGAAEPHDAERLYLDVVDALRAKSLAVETGTFRAMMLVECEVDGPVTIQIDSRRLSLRIRPLYSQDSVSIISHNAPYSSMTTSHLTRANRSKSDYAILSSSTLITWMS